MFYFSLYCFIDSRQTPHKLRLHSPYQGAETRRGHQNDEKQSETGCFLLCFDHLDSLARGILTTFGGGKIF